MNRRNFLIGAAALVGGVLVEETIPLGRVWSFPTNVVIAKPLPEYFVVNAVLENERYTITSMVSSYALRTLQQKLVITDAPTVDRLVTGDIISISGESYKVKKSDTTILR